MAGKKSFWDFEWLDNELEIIAEHMKRRETWLLIGMLLIVGGLIFVAIYYMLQFDFMLKLRNLRFSCASIGNLQTVALFMATLAFVMAMLTAFGEFAHYVDNKRRGYPESKGHARNTMLLLAATLAIGSGIIYFLAQICGG